MKLDIHPAAESNYNSKAEELISYIKEVPRVINSKTQFKPDIHVAAEYNEEDMIGEYREASIDNRGKTVERFFYYENKRYGILSQDYQNLMSIAESIQRLPVIRSKLSLKFIEETLFEWVINKYSKKNVSGQFTSHLQSKAEESIKSIRVMVPIANLAIEEPFIFGSVSIETISRSIIDEWENALQKMPDEHKSKVIELINQCRKDFQGYAAVVINLECEPSYAGEVGFEEAKRVTDLMGIFSGAVLIPYIKCVSRIKGSENIESSTVLKISNNSIHIEQQMLESSSAKVWIISKEKLNNIQNCGLNQLSFLLSLKKPNNFQNAVLSMAYLYSKAAFTSDPMEKVVYMLSALESILLKNENEPIQQNLSERIAVFSVRDLPTRKSIIKNIKTVYGMRSRYLHHGHSSNELEILKEFYFRVWLFFCQLLASVNNFESREQFLEAIDDHKLS